MKCILFSENVLMFVYSASKVQYLIDVYLPLCLDGKRIILCIPISCPR